MDPIDAEKEFKIEPVTPLVRALRDSFPGGSLARQYLIVGGCVAGLTSLLFTVIRCGVPWPGLVLPVVVASLIATALLQAIAQKSSRRQTIEMLEALETGNPLQLREALPQLRAVAADRLEPDREVRELAAVTAARIETAIQRYEGLPVPANAPAPAGGTLPLPATRGTEPKDLPRPT